MPLSYDAPERIFTLSTERTTYQMRVDEHGYLLHLYYGTRTSANTSYLITYADRSGMCGCPHDVADRTYSLDVLPQEYPFQGEGDMRSPLLMVRGDDGTFGCDLRYKSHDLRDGKYGLPGLPAVYDEGQQDAAQTLSITLADERLGLLVELQGGLLALHGILLLGILLVEFVDLGLDQSHLGHRDIALVGHREDDDLDQNDEDLLSTNTTKHGKSLP